MMKLERWSVGLVCTFAAITALRTVERLSAQVEIGQPAPDSPMYALALGLALVALSLVAIYVVLKGIALVVLFAMKCLARESEGRMVDERKAAWTPSDTFPRRRFDGDTRRRVSVQTPRGGSDAA